MGGIFLLFPPILAIVFGHVSQAKAKREGIKAGQGMSLAGLIMGYLSIAVVPIVGLLAAMAIPAFQKVRTVSQEKAMLNNARMLSSGADQYFLEYGKTTAVYGDFVGGTNFVREIHTVAGERYPTVYVQGQPIIVTKRDGKTVTFNP
jgi:type IV pilus assembly protein PilA